MSRHLKDYKVGEQFIEDCYGVMTVISNPIKGEGHEGRATYALQAVKNGGDGTPVDYLQTEGLEHYGPQIRRYAPLLEEDLENLRHMLGAEPRYKKRDWGFRNRYCSSNDDASMERLIANYLVVRGETINDGKNTMYYATFGGCLRAGLSPKKAGEVAV